MRKPKQNGEQHLAPVVETWRRATHAAAVNVCLLPKGQCCSAPGVLISTGAVSCRSRILARACPVMAAGRARPLAAAPATSTQVDAWVCLTTEASRNQLLGLQVAISPSDPKNPQEWAGAALPMLLLAKVSRDAGNRDLAAGPADGHPRPTSEIESVLRQLPSYAHDVRAGYRERRHLERLLRDAAIHTREELLSIMKRHEEEREWLAIEVHDRIGQSIAALFQQFQTLESMTRDQPEYRRLAVRGSALCREAMQEARNIMNDLRPPLLEDLGLEAVIDEELARLEDPRQYDVDCRISIRKRFPLEVELVLYRIFHEALLNVRRHSSGSRVTVQLACAGRVAQLVVADNGCGFDVLEAMAKKRIGGLLSMQRRAEAAGGTCRIESCRESGTRIEVALPVRAFAAEGAHRQ